MRKFVVVMLLCGALSPARVTAAGFAEACDPPAEGPAELKVGVVGCQRIDSENLGGVTAFGYFIPPACSPETGNRCPVLYYLHGTGGSYLEGVGALGGPGGAWVRALTSGPPVDPRTVADPTVYADTSTWIPKPPLDMIIVAPHGMTVPGGYGPSAGKETFWFDWNPKYAKGGAYEKYSTPAPKVGTFLQDEFVRYVDGVFPSIPDRTGRAIVGYSMGGIGAFANGFQRPDIWSSQGMRSGGGWPEAWFTDKADLGLSVAPPVEVPYAPVPGFSSFAAHPTVWEEVLYGPVLTTGFGDPAVDNIWYRGNQAAPLASNVSARGANGRQSTHLKYFVNDAIPRRPDDDVVGFETILYPTNLNLEQVLDHFGIERTFHVGPGDHSSAYAVPYFREQLEQQYANLRHRDGSGDPRPQPASFSYRTIKTDFTVWGWRFHIDREPVEFLHLTDVTCDGLIVRGTGTVTITPPPSCGKASVSVDLGPSQATDEHGYIGNSASYGTTKSVPL